MNTRPWHQNLNTLPPAITPPRSLHYAAMASILDSPIQTGEPAHELSSIFSQISLYDDTLPVAHQPPPPCSPVKFKQRPGPRKQPISAAPRWIPPPAATPTRAKRSRTVEFKLGVLSWAHYAHWAKWTMVEVEPENLPLRRFSRDLVSRIRIRYQSGERYNIQVELRVLLPIKYSILFTSQANKFLRWCRRRHFYFRLVVEVSEFDPVLHDGRNSRRLSLLPLQKGEKPVVQFNEKGYANTDIILFCSKTYASPGSPPYPTRHRSFSLTPNRSCTDVLER